MRRIGAIVIGLSLAGGFYMVLIDSVSLPELYAGAGVVALATLAYAASLQQGFSEAAVRPAWLLRAWRPLSSVPGHIALVSWEAIRQLVDRRPRRGVFRAVPFAAGDDPDSVGRRALSEILGSLAPNTIVVGVDVERQLLFVHQLRPSGSEEDLDVLRLG
jgi:multisubunit Na+/H+ antiporter MnhE subunit